MTKMREEFEAWYAKQEQFGKGHEEYTWHVWQASRAALCVELPKMQDNDVLSLWDLGFNKASSAANDCLYEQGNPAAGDELK